MSVSRRTFVKTIGVGGAGALAVPLIAARGHEALIGDRAVTSGLSTAELRTALRKAAPSAIRLDSNENPNGPGAVALDAIRGTLGEASRYPDLPGDALAQAIARLHGIAPESVVLGCGSGEVLRMAVYAFTAMGRPLVTAAPTFEDPAGVAETIWAPVRSVPLDGALRLDLSGMAAATRGAGLVFVCNPNNPTGTVHSAQAMEDFVRRVNRDAADATILIDEAYHEYVDDPTYRTSIPLAMTNPRVVVSRTFSKVFGLAGLRVGYAVGQPETMKALQRYKLGNGVNVAGAAAALAALGQPQHIEAERHLNREAKDFTRRSFEEGGYKVVPSDTNFIMVDIRRDTKAFQTACRKLDVLVGRPFPPLMTHARISIGTMDEMRRAVDVFRQVLATT
jgi:histidinol-phosphate aminotransferase